MNPAATETERLAEGLNAAARAAGVSLEEARGQMLAGILCGRLARPDEIADAVLFLASERASYINGVNISVDGAMAPVVL